MKTRKPSRHARLLVALLLVAAYAWLKIMSAGHRDRPLDFPDVGMVWTGMPTTGTSLDSATQMDEEAARRAAIRRKILEDIDARAAAHEEAIATLCEGTRTEITQGLDEATEAASRQIESILRALCGFKGCAKLCYRIVKDSASGSTETDAMIHTELNPKLIDPCVAAAARAETALARLADEAARAHTGLATDLMASANGIVEEGGLAGSPGLEGLLRKVGEVQAQAEDIAIASGVSATTLAASTAVLAFTGSAKSVAISALGAIANRMGASTALALCAAASDGPVPIGDIIAIVIEIGAGMWSAYDLYHAQTTMRDEMGQSLHAAIADFRRTSLETAASQIASIREAAASEKARMLCTLKAEIESDGDVRLSDSGTTTR